MASDPSNVREVGKRRSRTSRSPIVMAMLPPMIERHGKNDDDSRDDLLHPVRQSPLRCTELNNSHNGGADQRSEYGTSSAQKTSPADDDSGNHIEFEADGNRRVPDR